MFNVIGMIVLIAIAIYIIPVFNGVILYLIVGGAYISHAFKMSGFNTLGRIVAVFYFPTVLSFCLISINDIIYVRVVLVINIISFLIPFLTQCFVCHKEHIENKLWFYLRTEIDNLSSKDEEFFKKNVIMSLVLGFVVFMLEGGVIALILENTTM